MKFILLIALYSLLSTSTIFSASFQQSDPKTQQNEDIKQLIKHAEQLRDSSFTESIKTGKEALKLAIRTKNPKILAASNKSLGVTYSYQGGFDSAHYYYLQALNQFISVNDSLNIGKVHGNIGILYRKTGQYGKALEQYVKAIDLYKSLNYQGGLAGGYLNIGGVYQKLGNYEKALNFYFNARDIYKLTKNERRLASVLTNIGVLYNQLGEFEKSLSYQLQALELNEKSGDALLTTIILLNIGHSYDALLDYEKALDYYTQCELLRIQLNDYWGLSKIYKYKAITYEKTNQLELAEEYFLKAAQVSVENNLDDDLMETYLFYSKFLEKNQRPQQAIDYLKKYHHINDSLANNYRDEKIAKLTAKFESEQDKKEFVLLQQKSQIQDLKLGEKNAWIITLIFVLLLGAIAITVSLRTNRLRAAHKIMDLRQKVLLTQMNPHFLFNSLTAIQSFILDEKNDEANNYLSRLATLVRGILENSREEFVSLRTELDTLKDYISLQKLRFENEIHYQFEIDEDIDQDEIVVPPMLAQPFVENALIHGGLRNMPDAKIEVKVSLSRNKEQVRFQIIDNGIGIEESKSRDTGKKTHKSLATSIALDRVKIYNFKSSKKMNFELIDLKTIQPDKNGTLVTYSIPLQINED